MIYKIISDYSDIVISYDVKRYYQLETTSAIVIDFNLKAGYKLFVKDYFFVDGNRKYSFHFQDSKNELIFRYDNAPHWDFTESFPHHKHSNGEVQVTKEITLADMFLEILEYFIKHGIVNRNE